MLPGVLLHVVPPGGQGGGGRWRGEHLLSQSTTCSTLLPTSTSSPVTKCTAVSPTRVTCKAEIVPRLVKLGPYPLEYPGGCRTSSTGLPPSCPWSQFCPPPSGKSTVSWHTTSHPATCGGSTVNPAHRTEQADGLWCAPAPSCPGAPWSWWRGCRRPPAPPAASPGCPAGSGTSTTAPG